MDTCPTPVLITGAILGSPIWIPAVALFGAYQGIKAVIIHGNKGIARIAAASRKEKKVI